MFPLRDDVHKTGTAYAVYLLIAANAAIFLYMLTLSQSDLMIASMREGLVPRRYFEKVWAIHYGMRPDSYRPFLTYQFIHGGWFHIILNMWTLYIFGRSLEDRMGAVPFVLFYLVCGVAAGALHVWFNRESPVPVVGASGAIAGVIGAYAATFPRARITVLIPIIIIPLIFAVPAIAFAGVWFALQVAQGASSVLMPLGGSSVAWWAHVGGFVAGVAIVLPFLRWLRPPRSPWQRPMRG